MALLLAAASPLAVHAAPPDAPGHPEIMTTAHQDVLPPFAVFNKSNGAAVYGPVVGWAGPPTLQCVFG